MSQRLREISVTVTESNPDAFKWLLLERDADEWRRLEAASASVDSYREAMANNLLRLQSLIDDLERGPRKTDRLENKPTASSRPRERHADSSQSADGSSNKSLRGTAFGFGKLA